MAENEGYDETASASVPSATTNGSFSGTAGFFASPRESGQRASEARPARIVIADDYEPVRKELRNAFHGAGWLVCGEAANGQEAIEKAVELKPDVVILDISMPVMGGFEAAPQILQRVPGVKIVVFTMHESQQIRNEMLGLGVHGLAVKSAPLSDLLNEIRSVLAA
ncbi:MAG TPA: response regulator transcription factor [Candidatus Acidoferrales bacterium]|nr:response regulator transcription factor [Candidatus Acidoferrales bacterium]